MSENDLIRQLELDRGETLEQTIDGLAQTVEEHIELFNELRQQRDALKAGMEVIKMALNDGVETEGCFWPARKWLDDRGIYNGDLADLRVLYAVARAALAQAEGK